MSLASLIADLGLSPACELPDRLFVPVVRPPPAHPCPADARMQAIERLPRRVVDIVQAQARAAEEARQIDVVNPDDPNYRVRFRDLPHGLVRACLAGGMDAGDVVAVPALSVFDAVMAAACEEWEATDAARRAALTADLRRAVWEEVSARKLDGADEVQRGLLDGPPSALPCTAVLRALQDFFRITLLVHDGERVRGAGTKTRQRPVLLLAHGGEWCRVSPGDASPFFVWSEHGALLEELTEAAGAPAPGLSFAQVPELAALAKRKVGVVREVLAALGMEDRRFEEGGKSRPLTKAAMLEALATSTFTEEEADAVRRALAEAA